MKHSHQLKAALKKFVDEQSNTDEDLLRLVSPMIYANHIKSIIDGVIELAEEAGNAYA